jgi:hypothetical protein
MLVPTYLLLGRFSNTVAVALSNCSIVAASIASMLVVVPRRRWGSHFNAAPLRSSALGAGPIKFNLNIRPPPPTPTPRRHPHADRPLVAWDLILLLQPPTSLGAIYVRWGGGRVGVGFRQGAGGGWFG